MNVWEERLRLLSYIATIAMAVAAAIMVIIANGQLKEARNERMAAKEAVERAILIEERLGGVEKRFLKTLLLQNKITWLQVQGSKYLGGTEVVEDEVINELDAILKETIPDEQLRAEWIEQNRSKLSKKDFLEKFPELENR